MAEAVSRVSALMAWKALLGSSRPAAFRELELADPTGVRLEVAFGLLVPASAAAPLLLDAPAL